MPESTRQRPHIPQVDYIRAIASLAVALFHLGGKALPVLNYGWLGVEMFFLLSGFIICRAMPGGYTLKTAPGFIVKRIVRIEPPYLISIGLLLLLNYATMANYKADWDNVLFHLAYINNFVHKAYLNPVYWTLGIEFQFYIFIALIFPLILTNWGKWLVLALCILAMFLPVPGGLLFGVFPLFALGMLYYQYRVKQIKLFEFILFGLAVAAIGIILLGWKETCAGLFALLLLVLPLKQNIIISFLARISFSLYLTHDIIGSRLVVYLGTLWPKTFFYKGIEFITGILISVLFAWLFNLLIEAPFFKWSKSISYKYLRRA